MDWNYAMFFFGIVFGTVLIASLNERVMVSKFNVENGHNLHLSGKVYRCQEIPRM